MRRQYAEVTIFYQHTDPQGCSDTYSCFIDKKIISQHQDNEPHITNTGSISYMQDPQEIDENEVSQFVFILKEIYKEMKALDYLTENSKIN